MHIIMNETLIKVLDYVRQCLNGLETMEFTIETKGVCYAWVQTMLLRFYGLQHGKAEKGLLLDFLKKVSGYSRIPVKRLTQQSPHRRQR